MHNLMKFFGGIGILIAIYLFLSNGGSTISIVNTISKNMINGIQVLQGREKLITE